MMPTQYMPTTQVSYFAVYPDGRRLSVSRDSVEAYGDAWLREGVELETEVVTDVNTPAYGKVSFLPPKF